MKTIKLLSLFLCLVAANLAFAKEPLRRYALLVGNNDGGRERVTLHYAVSDARTLGKVFQELGGVQKEDLYLLDEAQTDKLKDTLQTIKDKIALQRDNYERIEFFFYYSGHSDSEGLLIKGKKLDYSYLRNSIKDIPADLKVAVLDSCASGAITRLKGGVKKAPFLVDSSMRMKGYAFITSSSHDEASQESDRIKGSFFTYYFVSGLRGAADLSQDGRVTLNEVYQFAFHETLSRTEKTASGAQHPGYEIQMSGSGDVVLTDLRKTNVLLVFDKNINGRISIRNRQGVFVAELAKTSGKEIQLSLEADHYQVLLEKENKVYAAMITLQKGREVFDFSKMQPVTISKNTGKGEEEYVHVPWSFAILPSISTGEVENKKVIHNYSLNLIADYSDRFSGFALGTVNLIGEDGDGVLIGAGGNYIKGMSSGFQLAGTLNYVGKEFSGFQVSGGLNYVKKDMDGFQLSVANFAGKTRGTQMGVVNISADLAGPQVGLINIADDVDGAQLGLVNIARGKVSGTQIGFVNIADENEVPIGFVNIIKNGRFNPVIWTDQIGMWNLGLKMGGKYFYSLVFMGTTYDTAQQVTGYGLGGHIPLIDDFYVEIDTVFQDFWELGKLNRDFGLEPDGHVSIVSSRLSVGLELVKGVHVFGGLALPFVYTNHEGASGIISRVKKAGVSDIMDITQWFIGIQFF